MTQVVTFLEVLLTPQFVLMVGHVDKSDESGLFRVPPIFAKGTKDPGFE